MTDEFDARKYLLDELDRNFRESVANRNFLWDNYWEGRRMVTVPDEAPSMLDTPEHRTNMVERDREFSRRIDAMKSYEPVNRPFASFPNLAPKDGPIVMTTDRIAERIIIDRVDVYQKVIRNCIVRLRAARMRESTNRHLGALLAVVVKVQKDLESLVGNDWRDQDDWQKADAAVESQVTRDDRSL